MRKKRKRKRKREWRRKWEWSEKKLSPESWRRCNKLRRQHEEKQHRQLLEKAWLKRERRKGWGRVLGVGRLPNNISYSIIRETWSRSRETWAWWSMVELRVKSSSQHFRVRGISCLQQSMVEGSARLPTVQNKGPSHQLWGRGQVHSPSRKGSRID